jgi:hypothetical protein
MMMKIPILNKNVNHTIVVVMNLIDPISMYVVICYKTLNRYVY